MKNTSLYPKLCRFLINQTPYLPYILKSIILYLLPQKIYAVTLSDNLKILVDVREQICNYIYFNKCYEPALTKYFLKYIKQGSFVIDIGAHVGYYTLLAAGIVGSQGRVISFEPYYRNYNLLKKTIHENNLKNVILETFAVADKKGKIKMYFPCSYNLGSGSIFNYRQVLHTSSYFKKKLLVNTICLDDYLLEKNIRNIDLVKIDAEGAELSILNGMRKGLKDNIYKVIILDFRSENNIERVRTSKIKRILKSFQYKLYHIIDKDTLIPDKDEPSGGYYIVFAQELI